MARLLTANVKAVLAHMLRDIAVADVSTGHRQADAFQIALKTEVAHDRCNNAAGG